MVFLDFPCSTTCACATRSSGTADAGMMARLPIHPDPDLPLIAALTILPLTRMPPAWDEVVPPPAVEDVVLLAAGPVLVVLGVPHLLLSEIKTTLLLDPLLLYKLQNCIFS